MWTSPLFYLCVDLSSLNKIICLFGSFFPLENFHSYGDVSFADEGFQIMTYARHSWPLSSRL